MRFWQLLFELPDGSVYGNIIASLIWAAPPLTYAMIKQYKHHRKVEDSLERLHQKVQKIADKQYASREHP